MEERPCLGQAIYAHAKRSHGASRWHGRRGYQEVDTFHQGILFRIFNPRRKQIPFFRATGDRHIFDNPCGDFRVEKQDRPRNPGNFVRNFKE